MLADKVDKEELDRALGAFRTDMSGVAERVLGKR
jgi:hypothetical protein